MWYYLDLLLERSAAQWALAIAGVILALIALDYVVLYRPLSQGIARVHAGLEIARLEQTRLRRQADQAPRLRQELAALRRALRSRFPRVVEPVDPLERVTARAAMAGLEVARFQPGATVAGEFLTEGLLEVEFTGTYHDLLRFLDSAAPATLPDTRSLTIETLPGGDGTTRLRITMEMATLRLPPDTGEANRVMEAAGGAGTVDVPAPHGPPRRPDDDDDSHALLRDPFEPYRLLPAPGTESPEPVLEPVLPLPELRFQAMGIVWGRDDAAALLKDTEGYGYVVRPGSRLGDGSHHVVSITPCEVVLDATPPAQPPREVRLPVRHCDSWKRTEAR